MPIHKARSKFVQRYWSKQQNDEWRREWDRGGEAAPKFIADFDTTIKNFCARDK